MVTIEPPERVSSGGGVETWRVRWSSDLPDPEYIVWSNGSLLFEGPVTIEELLVTVPSGGQLLIEVRDNVLVPEPVFSGVVVVGWNAARSAARYRVEQWDGAAWQLVSRVENDGRGWYEFQTEELDDVTETRFRVVSERANGEGGVPCEWRVPMARHPDVPVVEESYDEGTGLLTFS